jgi:hypothetical protein
MPSTGLPILAPATYGSSRFLRKSIGDTSMPKRCPLYQMIAKNVGTYSIDLRQSAACKGKHPVSEIGSRTIPRAVQTGDGEWQDLVNTMVCFTKEVTAKSGGCATGIVRQPTLKIGRKRSVDGANAYKLAIKTPCRQSAGARRFY